LDLSVYLDTSLLVPLFAADALADRAEAWLEAGPGGPVVSDLAEAEFVAAIGAKAGSHILLAAEAQAALDNFPAWTAMACRRVLLAPEDLARATGWMRRFDLNLRTPDALHLALAARLELAVATFDQGMVRAAQALGLPLALP
jgi:predicted nucleic acid-binding protein